MGLSSPESTVSILHVMNGITGAAIKIPDGINAMLQPGGGVMDAINAYIGSCPEGAGFASLTCGPGIGPRPAPISIFSKGLNQFLGITLCDGELNVKGTGMTVAAAKSIFTGGTWKYAGSSFTVAGNVTMAGKTGLSKAQTKDLQDLRQDMEIEQKILDGTLTKKELIV